MKCSITNHPAIELWNHQEQIMTIDPQNMPTTNIAGSGDTTPRPVATGSARPVERAGYAFFVRRNARGEKIYVDSGGNRIAPPCSGQ
jgi:hypothetical protein